MYPYYPVEYFQAPLYYWSWPNRLYPLASAYDPRWNDCPPNNYAYWIERAGGCITKSVLSLKNSMRSLWEQHVAWTRMAIRALAFDLPDTDVTLARLLKNASDMGNALKPLYGEEVAEKFSKLIANHLTIAAELVKAAKAGNQQAAAEIEKKWYANGDDIVELMSSINPHLSKVGLKTMFYEHLALTKEEAVKLLQKDYQGSIDVYDKIEAEALEMSDAMSDAIIRQFPNKFR